MNALVIEIGFAIFVGCVLLLAWIVWKGLVINPPRDR